MRSGNRDAVASKDKGQKLGAGLFLDCTKLRCMISLGSPFSKKKWRVAPWVGIADQ